MLSEDADSVARLKAGDPSGLEALYRRYVERVWRYGWFRTRSREAAAEIVQETFLRVARSIGGFEGRSAFGTWLFAIVRRAAVEHVRRERRDRETFQGPTILRLVPAAETPDALEVEDSREAVRRAVAEMPAAARRRGALRALRHEHPPGGRSARLGRVARESDAAPRAPAITRQVEGIRRRRGAARRANERCQGLLVPGGRTALSALRPVGRTRASPALPGGEKLKTESQGLKVPGNARAPYGRGANVMECTEARQRIDERLDARCAEAPAADPQRGAELDTHLAACPACAAEWRELSRTRGLLAAVAEDKPESKEIETMWTAIQAGAFAPPAMTAEDVRAALRFWQRPVWRLALTGLAIAAVLAFAFGLGAYRFGMPESTFSLARARQWATAAYSPSVSKAQTTSALWEAVRRGEVKAGTHIAPSSGDAVDPSGANATDTFHDFSDTGNISFGYQVPIVPAGEPTLEKMSGSRSATAFNFGQPGADLSQEKLIEQLRIDPAPPGEKPRGELTKSPQTKTIKTADLDLEVPSHDEAVAKVETIVGQYGGFVADASTQEQAGGALLGKVVIRVAPERFEALFAALKTLGRVEAENVKAADVTAEYVDLEARIKGLQITEERLQELIKNKSLMDKVSSLLEVEREVTRVRSQIEQLQGQLRVMADRVALSTITVTLREPARTVPSASLSIEVPVVEEAAEALGKSLESLGGRVLSGKISKRQDGTLMGEYQLLISLSRFGDLLAAIEGLGRINERQVKDRQFGDASAPWADKVKCGVGLTLYERGRQLPSATVKLEVEVLDTAIKALDAPLNESGGAVVSNQATRREDGSSSADLKLRVPAGQFAKLVETLDSLGRTVSKQVAGESGQIVGGASSVPCEIALTLAEKPRQVPSGSMAIEVASFEPARNALSKLIAEKGVHVLGSGSSQRTDGTWTGSFNLAVKASEMDALVERLEGLGRVASRQIIGLGLGDLSRSDPNALGVIQLTLAEKAAFAPGPERTADSLRSRIRDGLAGLYASLGLIAYGLVVMAPWLVIVIALAWLTTRYLRRRAESSRKPAKAAAGGAPA